MKGAFHEAKDVMKRKMCALKLILWWGCVALGAAEAAEASDLAPPLAPAPIIIPQLPGSGSDAEADPKLIL